jgi:hypothetical protein
VRRLSPKVVAVAVAVTAVVAGAGLAATQLLGSSDASSDLERFVLQASDLSSGYRRVQRVTPAEGCSDPAFKRGEIRRLRARGVVGCTLVRYRRQEGNGHRFGVVFLVVYLFDDVARASAALPQFTNDYLARGLLMSSASTALRWRRWGTRRRGECGLY